MSAAQDLQFALRMIRKRPWFSAAIVVTLGFGMGINTTVFSLVNAVLFKPLPFPGGERLMMANEANPQAGRDSVSVSYADYRSFRETSQSFERLEIFNGFSVTLAEHGNPPQRFRGCRISAGMFDMLHMQPIIGRGMQPADEKPGADPVILLGYGVWKDRYAKDPSVVGRRIRANEKPAVIIGVMPEGFKFPSNEDLWMAIVPDARGENRGNRDYQMVGMLKPGISIGQSHVDLNLIAGRLAKEYPATNKDYGATVRTFHEAMNGGRIRNVFLLMMGAVGFVLLIACANVANMLLGRALERTREVSIRAAMGASRWRLIRQLLIESILLAAMGGTLGLGLATLGIRVFASAVADVGKPYWIDFSMNYAVFGYFAALTIVTGVLFGLAPALSASRINLNDTLKDGMRSSGGVGAGYLSGGLVVFQFTLAVVLLSGAGLMMRSFLVAQNEFSGMNGEKVLTARLNLPGSRYAKPEDRQQFFEKLRPRLAFLPGVQKSAMVSDPPGDGAWSSAFEIAGRPIAEARQRPVATTIVAWKGYPDLLRIGLLSGRDLEDSDGVPGKETVIVSQTMVSRFFPHEDPIGKQIRLFRENQPRPWMTIIGVIPDFRQRNAFDTLTDPTILLPYRFENSSGMTVLLRTENSAPALSSALRTEVQRLDADLPLSDIQTLAERFRRQRWHLPVFGTVFLIFAITAMAMAAVGIYAVMANAAMRRTREIGVRIALGAGEGSILGLVLGRGLKQLILGMVLGLAAALAVCRLMKVLLFQVSPNDPVTFVAVTLTLGMAGITAIFFPARRAAKLDPVQALRYE